MELVGGALAAGGSQHIERPSTWPPSSAGPSALGPALDPHVPSPHRIRPTSAVVAVAPEIEGGGARCSDCRARRRRRWGRVVVRGRALLLGGIPDRRSSPVEVAVGIALRAGRGRRRRRGNGRRRPLAGLLHRRRRRPSPARCEAADRCGSRPTPVSTTPIVDAGSRRT